MIEQHFAEILADCAPVFCAPVRLRAMVACAERYVAPGADPNDPWREAWLRGSEWPPRKAS